jgi:hypothetical protein
MNETQKEGPFHTSWPRLKKVKVNKNEETLRKSSSAKKVNKTRQLNACVVLDWCPGWRTRHKNGCKWYIQIMCHQAIENHGGLKKNV